MFPFPQGSKVPLMVCALIQRIQQDIATSHEVRHLAVPCDIYLSQLLVVIIVPPMSFQLLINITKQRQHPLSTPQLRHPLRHTQSLLIS